MMDEANGTDQDSLLAAKLQDQLDPASHAAREIDKRCHARVMNEMATGRMPIGKTGANLLVAYRDEAINANLREADNIRGFMRTIYGIMRALHVEKVEVGPETMIIADNHIIGRNDALAEKPGNMVFFIMDTNQQRPQPGAEK